MNQYVNAKISGQCKDCWVLEESSMILNVMHISYTFDYDIGWFKYIDCFAYSIGNYFYFFFHIFGWVLDIPYLMEWLFSLGVGGWDN